MASHVMLTPCNDTYLTINQEILQPQVRDVTTYFAADHAEVPDNLDEASNYPQEFLHALAPSGIPPHALELKVGCIVMLLRNLDLSIGLCNGTQLFVQHLYRNRIRAEVLGGSHAGNLVLIPKITLRTSDVHLPFRLCSIQLPVHLAYFMTTNKAQRQTFQKVGLDLSKPVFAYGQLYVTLSRATTEEGVRVKLQESEEQGFHNGMVFTKNVVNPEIIPPS